MIMLFSLSLFPLFPLFFSRGRLGLIRSKTSLRENRVSLFILIGLTLGEFDDFFFFSIFLLFPPSNSGVVLDYPLSLEGRDWSFSSSRPGGPRSRPFLLGLFLTPPVIRPQEGVIPMAPSGGGPLEEGPAHFLGAYF